MRAQCIGDFLNSRITCIAVCPKGLLPKRARPFTELSKCLAHKSWRNRSWKGGEIIEEQMELRRKLLGEGASLYELSGNWREMKKLFCTFV